MNPNLIYRIRVRGCLAESWADWLDGMTMTQNDDSTTFAGPVRDQAQLHGLLARVRDAGLQLIAVTRDDAGVSEGDNTSQG